MIVAAMTIYELIERAEPTDTKPSDRDAGQVKIVKVASLNDVSSNEILLMELETLNVLINAN